MLAPSVILKSRMIISDNETPIVAWLFDMICFEKMRIH